MDTINMARTKIISQNDCIRIPLIVTGIVIFVSNRFLPAKNCISVESLKNIDSWEAFGLILVASGIVLPILKNSIQRIIELKFAK